MAAGCRLLRPAAVRARERKATAAPPIMTPPPSMRLNSRPTASIAGPRSVSSRLSNGIARLEFHPAFAWLGWIGGGTIMFARVCEHSAQFLEALLRCSCPPFFELQTVHFFPTRFPGSHGFAQLLSLHGIHSTS